MKTKEQSSFIGKHKQRITFEYYTTSTDGMGGTAQTWNSLATVWGNVKHLSGREAMELDALKGNVKAEITTRYRDDFITKGYDRSTYDYALRAKYNGSIYNIEYAIDKGEENSYTYLIATKEVGDEA